MIQRFRKMLLKVKNVNIRKISTINDLNDTATFFPHPALNCYFFSQIKIIICTFQYACLCNLFKQSENESLDNFLIF